MTNATFIQRGEALDYTNSTNKTIPAGSIIPIGKIVGVASTDIEPSALGAVHVTGVFAMPKKATVEISMGEPVYLEDGVITNEAGAENANIPAGYAVSSAASSATEVAVKLRG